MKRIHFRMFISKWYGLFLFAFILLSALKTVENSEEKTVGHNGLNYSLLEHEQIGRSLYATPLISGQKVYSGEGTFDAEKRKVYVGWRLLANDPKDIAFNIYRQDESGSIIKLNPTPQQNSTNIIDAEVPKGNQFQYIVVPVIDGKEKKDLQTQPYLIDYNQPIKEYKSVKLTDDHTFEKIAFADLDGDGNLDFITKHPGGNIDPWYLYWKPSPGTYKLEAYKSTGEHLWTHDMGWAIEMGAWYSPYLAYDFNGDGKAEVAVKSGESDPRNKEGKVMSGPEYLTIMDGETGKQIAQSDWIPREPFFEVNDQHAYNFASRNQLAVAYLDGVHPHIVVLRGTYNLMMVRAYRLIDNELKLVWDWDNRNLREDPNNYWGQGGHWTIAADIDQDGFDELVLGSCALDHDGTILWTTGMGHNDAAYVADLLPEREGLEIYYNIEARSSNGNGMCMVDAETGEIIWGSSFPTHHVHGRGMCSDIDRVHPGREYYGEEIAPFEGKRKDFAVMLNSKGEIIDRDFTPILSAFWDTDNQRELVGDKKIFDYKGTTVFSTEVEGEIIAIGDIFGDWREEIITSVPGEIRIYSSTILANSRNVCLLQDPIYRNDLAHTSAGYYHVPMTTYDIPFIE